MGPVKSNNPKVTNARTYAGKASGSNSPQEKIFRPGKSHTAVTLVFVDVMKEMPITLMTRPFGWDTLSVRIFEMTSEGEWEQAALPAVALVLTGLIPIAMLTRQAEK